MNIRTSHKNGYKALVVDPEQKAGAAIADALRFGGFLVSSVQSIDRAKKAIETNQPDIMIVDLSFREEASIRLIQSIREGVDIPILTTSSSPDPTQKNKALSYGADDFISKPFNTVEFLLKIKSILKRISLIDLSEEDLQLTPVKELKLGDVKISLEERHVTIKGKPVALTMKEYSLLLFLMNNKGTILSRKEIIRNVWQASGQNKDKTVTEFVRRLRLKLDEEKSEITLITVRTQGYKIDFRPTNS